MRLLKIAALTIMLAFVWTGDALAGGHSPRATFTVSPAAPTTGQQVTFDASGSMCFSDTWSASGCSTYSWADDADANDPLDDAFALGTGKTMTFSFKNPGTKYVWLTLTDSSGRSTQTSTPVVVSASATPTSTPSPTPTPAPNPAPPPTSTFPNALTTGVPAGWTPTQTINGTYTVSTAGAVVHDIQVNGDLNVAAPNVTLQRVLVTGGSIDNRPGSTCFNGMTLDHVEMRPPISQAYDSDTDYPSIETGGYTAIGVKIWNRGEGFRVGGKSNGCGSVDVRDSFVKIVHGGDCAAGHNDGIQGYDGNALTMENDTIDFETTGPCQYTGTGAFFYPDQGNTRADIDGLLLEGGGYPIRLMTPGSVNNLKIVNHAWDYGPMDVTCAQVAWGAGNELVDIDSNYQITAHDGALACS
jgi:hypothetical protein